MSGKELSNWITTLAALITSLVALFGVIDQHRINAHTEALQVNHEKRTEAMESQVWSPERGFNLTTEPSK